MQDLILPMSPPQRRFTYQFHQCNFVHIPAIEHGFRSHELVVQVYDGSARLLLDAQLTIHPRMYLVTVAFVRGEFSLDAPRHERIQFFLMPPQSGIVVITGPIAQRKPLLPRLLCT